MNDRPRLNQGGYDYTTEPTRYRIIREDYGDDEQQWMLDGIDDERNYTEAVWLYETWENAMAAVPEFAKVVPLVSADHCYECDRVTRWDGETCTGCGRLWGHPAPDVTEPEPDVYEVVVERDGDGWTAALFPVIEGARDSMTEAGSGPTPRQALIDLARSLD